MQNNTICRDKNSLNSEQDKSYSFCLLFEKENGKLENWKKILNAIKTFFY